MRQRHPFADDIKPLQPTVGKPGCYICHDMGKVLIHGNAEYRGGSGPCPGVGCTARVTLYGS